MPTALIREIADTFDQAIVSEGGRAPDPDRARAEHAVYRQALLDAGYEVEVIPADDAHPDCVFIEDTAIVVGAHVVATRPGAPSRRGEVRQVIEHFSGRAPVSWIEAPGTIEGGDVMILGERLFAGMSRRTNRNGIDQLRRVAESQGISVIGVPVDGVLHLKSGVRPIDDRTVVVTPGTVDESLLSGLRILHEPARERHAFSALPMINGKVLVTASAPDTTSLLVDLGVSVLPIDVSEIQAADGGLTCLSILIDDQRSQTSARTTQ